MPKYEVWVFMGSGRKKEIIEAGSLVDVADIIREVYRGFHDGFFIMSARVNPQRWGRSLPYDRWGGVDYGEGAEGVSTSLVDKL